MPPIFLNSLASKEIAKITNAETFFNLSKHGDSPQVQAKIGQGRKFTPYLKINVEKQLKKFDSEIYSC